MTRELLVLYPKNGGTKINMHCIMGSKQFPHKPTHANPVCLFEDSNPKCLDLVLWLTKSTILMVGVSTFKPRLDKTPDNCFALQLKFGL